MLPAQHPLPIYLHVSFCKDFMGNSSFAGMCTRSQRQSHQQAQPHPPSLPISHSISCSQNQSGIKISGHNSSPVSPQLLHHVFYFLGTFRWIHLGITLGSKLCNVHFSKLFQSESPAVQARTEADGTEHWINLKGNGTATLQRSSHRALQNQPTWSQKTSKYKEFEEEASEL